MSGTPGPRSTSGPAEPEPADAPPGEPPDTTRTSTPRTGPAAPPAGAAGEIGDIAEGYWEIHRDEAATARMTAMARRLPALMASAVRMAWQASRTDTLTLIAGNLIAGAMTTAVLLSTQRVLGHLLSGMPTADRLRAALPALLVLAVLAGVRELLLSAAGRAQDRLRPRVDRLAEQYLFDVTTSVDAAAFEVPAWADAMLRARDQGTYRARMVVLDGSDLLTGVVGVAAAIIALGVLHPLLVPLAVIATLPDGWVAVKVAKMQYAVYRSISRVRRRMWIIGDRMADREHALELRANSLRGFLLREWGVVADIGQREQLAVADQEAVTRLAGRALSGAAALATYVLLGILLITGVLALAVAGTAVLAMQSTRSALGRVMSSVSRLYEDGLYFGDLLEFVDDAKKHLSPATGRAPTGPPNITCTDLTFRYPGAETDALTEVSLDIHAGQVLALVGENGSGKSTLAKLLAGLYAPTSGTITWDGTDITTVEPDALRSGISLISQDHVAWPLTARSNIAMALPRDPERIATAATAGCADRLIEGLPHGMDTILDKRFEHGTELSGGGRQRIAAARGLYRAAHGAALIIADEPTSEIDAEAEHELLEALLALRSPDRAIVLITHRLSAAKSADQILVLNHGNVVEQGSHTELMATAHGRYRRMFTLQALRYATTQPETLPRQ